MKAVAAALGLIALPLAAAKVSYKGYQAIHIDTADDLAHQGVAKALKGLNYVNLGCGGESDHSGFDIAVAPDSLSAFKKLGLESKIVREDIGADIDAEGDITPYVSMRKDNGSGALPDIAYFDSYHDFEGHLQFLKDLSAAFPDNSEIFSAGDSVEGRPLQGIHIWGSGGAGSKPAIIWHATVHAREWITAPTVEYMAYKLIEGYQNGDETPKATLDNYDFYIIPVVNPDGFVYTQTEDRMWRKNRQERDGARCVGTDVNRNWPHKWDVDGGSSPDPCAETYRGEEPGDTPENAALRNHTQAVGEANGIKFYVDWHSFSQLILLPYGYSCSAEADNIDQQMKLAGGVAEAIKGVNGLNFAYGPTCETIYQTAGGSNDWVFDIAGAELAWAFELRPQGGGSGGFAIPPDNIVPSGEENWAGMLNLFAAF
ncbi:Metallocarboxypeptidase A-like protein [Hapsidospora chrysogenum ATCC 11550]|uniref:Metallocarboxypeptidase A-like protein n=1 Tax=Hapsidospora chrysogenum (strain ATCC 11550 / CBS 779.69 / DSM 880 / IAM 14645 / JCM 23072 / IMI 49137) TaxID=857340 RepID=A0A086T5I0_HAPC1|nr:Metallocarboxypeptidase A-like protein [Hapsidospora chrysogenum ATCC 11550]